MRIAAFLAGLLVTAASGLMAQSCISLTAADTAYTQNFNSLASTGTSSVLPAGWMISESGTNANTTYTAGTGSGNAGDTYSFGAAGSSDRALGGLQSGSLVPTFGACFTNNTGAPISKIDIAYTGEQYRLGTSGRVDRIAFQYSLNAASLTTGTWTGVTALNFNSPVSTGTVGAVTASAPVSSQITGLDIAPGATVYIRWTDFNATGADDGLAVDDFSLTPRVNAGLSISDASVAEGNSGFTIMTFNVTLSSPAPAGGVTFDIATADGTAMAGLDYVAKSLTNQTIAAGATSYAFEVQVTGDTVYESNETLLVNVTKITGTDGAKTQATGTIVNDDTMPIHVLQSAGTASPFAGQAVTTEGVITAVKYNGYFIQTPVGSEDVDPLTSEGLFVFTGTFAGGVAPEGLVAGNLVRVTGTVTEFVSSSDPQSPPLTELTGSTFQVVSSGNTLPAPIVLDTSKLSPSGAFDQLERYEGMRVSVTSLDVIAPTSGTFTQGTASATSNGVFYGVLSGTPRPFREPGLELPEEVPAGPCCVPRFDANPERLRVDADALLGSPRLEVTPGAVVTNLVGPLDYGDRTYTILPEPGAAIGVAGIVAAIPVPMAPEGQFTVATSNLERFYDDVDDAGGDTVVSTAGYQRRLSKASLLIRNVLRMPDILAVQEAESLKVLQDLAARVNADEVSAGNVSPAYTAHLEAGNDVGVINVGFLVKSARVNVLNVSQYGKTETYVPPGTSSPALLNDRPPLVLDAEVLPPGGAAAYPVTVIVNHLRSLLSMNDPAETQRIAAKRRAQAESLANLVQTLQSADADQPILVVGDFNAFQFSDGYVDLTGTVRGVPTPASQVYLASADLVNPDLADAAAIVPPSNHYSYLFQGNAQTIDQILITQNLLPRQAGFAYARVNAEFNELLRNDAARPERTSDHDPAVAYFTFPTSDLSLSLTMASAPVTGMTAAYSLLVDNSSTEAAKSLQLSFPLPAGTTFAGSTAPAGWTCTTPAVGSIGSVTCTKPSLAADTTELVSVSVNVQCTLANGATLAATASVTSETYDPLPSNNTAVNNTAVSNPAPVISDVSVDKPVIWPPNGKMIDVQVSYSATDSCELGDCVLSVTSSDPENGIGDHNTSPDFEVVSAHVVRVRAESSGLNPSRVYTITITCKDSGGAVSTRTVNVTVPRSQGNGKGLN